MPENEFRLVLGQTCRHCGHVGSMKIVASHIVNSHLQERRFLYELLSCPACEGVTLRSSDVLDSTDSAAIGAKTIYPRTHEGGIVLQSSGTHTQSANQTKSRDFILRCLQNIRYYVKEWKSAQV